MKKYKKLCKYICVMLFVLTIVSLSNIKNVYADWTNNAVDFLNTFEEWELKYSSSNGGKTYYAGAKVGTIMLIVEDRPQDENDI